MATAADRAPNTENYTVGWITALHIEMAAAIAMLDEAHAKLPYDEHDPTLYTLGRIGPHNVVIVCLPGGQTGLSPATEVATRMLNKFRFIKIGFMVGIGGGIPTSEKDIRLGDVVVSLPDLDHGGVVQYDIGKAEVDGQFRRTGHLDLPPKLLLNVVQQARSDLELGVSTFEQHLSVFQINNRLRKFTSDQTGPDLLFQSSAAIWGLGGCGKSAVALEFLYRVRTQEPDRAIFWIRASSREHFFKAFRDIAILFDLPGAQDPEKDIMNAVKMRLSDETSNRWLLIVDNADDPEIILPGHEPCNQRLVDYLPLRTDCKILFTCRTRQAAVRLLGTSGPAIEVQSFGLSEAQDLYTTIVDAPACDKENCIGELLTELACLPLAIVQAAAFIREYGLTVRHYLDLFRGQDVADASTDLLGQEFEDFHRYARINRESTEDEIPSREYRASNAITKTLYITFKRLEDNELLAFRCLGHLSCVAPSDIPEALVVPWTEESSLRRTKAIGILVGHQFLLPQRKAGFFDTHPLVHLTAQRWFTLAKARYTYIAEATDLLLDILPYGGFHEHGRYRVYLPHALYLVSRCKNHTEHTIDLLSRIAACQRDLGDYSSAEKAHQEVFAWRRDCLGEQNDKTLRAMQEVGQDLMMQGNYSDAETQHRSVMNKRLYYCGLDDVATLSSLRNVAEALGFQEAWEECRMLNIELAKLGRAWLGPTHAITLSSFKALSICYCQCGWFTLAEVLARTVVEGRIQAEKFGEAHPSTLKSISNLASVLTHNKKWQKAETLELYVWQALERILGAEHPDTLTSKCNLARIRVYLDMKRKARESFEQVLETRLRLLGPEHPDTLISRSYVLRFCNDTDASKVVDQMNEVASDTTFPAWTEHANVIDEPDSELRQVTPQEILDLILEEESSDPASMKPTADEVSEAKRWSLPLGKNKLPSGVTGRLRTIDMHLSSLLTVVLAMSGMVTASAIPSPLLESRQSSPAAGVVYNKCSKPGVFALAFDDGPGQYT
ncbi:purine and uridine phosphorylase, partial [Aureobasidium melanogenum]